MVGAAVRGVEMADELIDDTIQAGEDEAPLSPRRKLLVGIVMSVAVLAAAALMVRISSPPIPPDQAEPRSHWGPRCGWCHNVSETAKPIEVKQ
jgi:hypothetical protein